MSNNLIDLLGNDDGDKDLSGYPMWMRGSPATMHFFDTDLAFRVKCYEARTSKENQRVIIAEAEHLFDAL